MSSNVLNALPIELNERILGFCHPVDVFSFSLTNRDAYNLVNNSPDQVRLILLSNILRSLYPVPMAGSLP